MSSSSALKRPAVTFVLVLVIHGISMAEVRAGDYLPWRAYVIKCVDTLIEHGVRSYSIYLDADTNTLFAYAEIDSKEQWNRIADTEVCRRWWTYMAPLMPTNDDYSPVSVELHEVFHVESK